MKTRMSCSQIRSTTGILAINFGTWRKRRALPTLERNCYALLRTLSTEPVTWVATTEFPATRMRPDATKRDAPELALAGKLPVQLEQQQVRGIP